MEFIKTHPLNARRVLIFAGVMLGAIFVLSTLTSMLRPYSQSRSFDVSENYSMGAPRAEYYNTGGTPGYELSVRNAAPMVPESMPPIRDGYAPGDSEAFEVRNYSAYIETNDLGSDCATVSGLKSRSEVVFENSSTYDHGCSFSFKVEKGSVDSVLEVLQSLNPKELNENVYTIKREVDDYTSEIDILTKKLAALDLAYTEAVAAYTSVTDLATKNGDIENLAKIIESKLMLIERLTGSRLQVAADLERMERAKAESLDRLVYTYFNVSITERVYVDGRVIKDSWRNAVENAIRETNQLLQSATVGLTVFVAQVLVFVLYALIVLLVVRFGWMYVRNIWGSMRGGGQGQQ